MLLSTQTDISVRKLGLEGGVEMLCRAGYDALDLSFFGTTFALGDDRLDIARKILNIAKQYGVIFNQAHAPFGGGYDHYTGELVPQFPKVFEFAGLLGVKQIVVHPLQRGRYYGHEKEMFDLNMDFYRSLKPLAANYGVKIAIENMWQTNPYGRYIVDDVCANPHELAAYYDTLDDPDNFTVCLDIGHVALCNREPEDAIRILGHDRLGALHVHDVDYKSDLHTLPGMGKINWDNVTDALRDIKYKGEFTFEADNFIIGFTNDFLPTAAAFMAARGRQLISKINNNA